MAYDVGEVFGFSVLYRNHSRDIVRSITVKNWQWEVLGINEDKYFVCDLAEPDICSADRIGANPPIENVLHPGSVKLVAKADPVNAFLG